MVGPLDLPASSSSAVGTALHPGGDQPWPQQPHFSKCCHLPCKGRLGQALCPPAWHELCRGQSVGGSWTQPAVLPSCHPTQFEEPWAGGLEEVGLAVALQCQAGGPRALMGAGRPPGEQSRAPSREVG